MAELQNLIGKTFGYWEVLSRLPNRNGSANWQLKCRCGNMGSALTSQLNHGGTTSCGCRRDQLAQARTTKHGKRNSPIYRVWCLMVQRTTNPNTKGWMNYGGRGITISEEWKVFENFYKDMGDVPEGLQLDREKNELGYSKENCRWVTRTVNARNKRNNVLVVYKGKEMTIAEASELSGMNRKNLYYRHSKGLRGEALFMKDLEPSPEGNSRNVFVEYEGNLVTVAKASELSGLPYYIIYVRKSKGLVGKELFKPVK